MCPARRGAEFESVRVGFGASSAAGWEVVRRRSHPALCRDGAVPLPRPLPLKDQYLYGITISFCGNCHERRIFENMKKMTTRQMAADSMLAAMCAEGQACPGGRVEPSPKGAPRSGDTEPALPGRPFQRAMRRQAAARRRRCRSAAYASRGVRQSRHLSGRSLSMRSIRLISSSRMASNGLPLGRAEKGPFYPRA